MKESNIKCSCERDEHRSSSAWRAYLPASISMLMLLTGIALDVWVKTAISSGYMRLGWYVLAYIPVGFPVIKEGFEELQKNSFFTEYTLMVIATVGAFAIGEYPEGVAVMLFYAVGELFQNAAVNKATNNIKALLDVRPSVASVWRGESYQSVRPEEVEVGEVIIIKAGEKVPLDGTMLSPKGRFNTSALTGESLPRTIDLGEKVLAGMLNIEKVVELKVDKLFEDSSLAKILDLVQNATAHKAKTELLIRRFAKIYTPIVFLLAVLLVFMPFLFVDDYVFSDWLYRGLVFLVISCPCALVISIPLGYFGGIGAASRNGILFKGSNYLDLMAKVNTVVMDKTGTLTEGVFEVQEINTVGREKEELIQLAAALELHSTHPIAKAIVAHAHSNTVPLIATDIEEIAGHGLHGNVNGKSVLVGNAKLMQKFGVEYDAKADSIVESAVLVSVDGVYAGYITITDKTKPDAAQTIKMLRAMGIKQIVMLSGDNNSITQKVASSVGINEAYGDLLPENKVEHLRRLKADPTKVIAFVGDGINDAPVLALSDVGIAMGAMGSDVAIETADVVIQTDQPSKIATAIQISKATQSIVFQNITLAFGVKIIVLILGAGSIAGMWEAVFADVGVALLAILNAVRIQNKQFKN